MVATILTHSEESPAMAEMLRPERLADGSEPEGRIVICGLSWERYLGLDIALGDDRPGPRFYYLDGSLEIMTTSNEHERIKEWIGGMLEIYFEETGLEVMPRGQATMRDLLRTAGAEPDKSWCIGEEKEFPDLVLEVALTSGGLDKLEIYRHFQVAEVWFWREGELEIFVLTDGANYKRARKSRLFPKLDVGALQRAAGIRSWRDARQAFRQSIISE